MKNSLILKNINFKADKNNILNNITLTAKPGEVTAILGPSGSGKSTLIKIIAGLMKANSGKIILGNTNINNLNPSARKIGYVSQNPSLLPYYNIWQNISLGLHNLSVLQQKRKSLEILKTIGMAKYIESFPNQLSIGQQQKISIARALISQPEILLFDEPYANLDVINKDNLIRQTLLMLKSSNAIKLLITHNPHEAMLASNYIYVLNKGSIVQSGKINELYDNPYNEFIARLFGMTNILPASVKENYAHTILGTHKISNVNHIQQSKKERKLLIRPNQIGISNKKNSNLIAATITDKRFYYGQNLYFLSLNNNKSQILKVINSTNYHINDIVYLKILDFHIL